jgi:phosphohistidine phosphatase
MKTLMLIRHAKSDWADLNLKDFDRPLNSRGLKDAPIMAQRLLKASKVPQHLISSPALRAKTTGGIFAKVLQLADPCYKAAIYDASYTTLLDVINHIPDAYNFVALFGHNPALSQALYNFTGEVRDMPTCAIAQISFDIDSWKLITADTGKLEYFDYPKNG